MEGSSEIWSVPRRAKARWNALKHLEFMRKQVRYLLKWFTSKGILTVDGVYQW